MFSGRGLSPPKPRRAFMKLSKHPSSLPSAAFKSEAKSSAHSSAPSFSEASSVTCAMVCSSTPSLSAREISSERLSLRALRKSPVSAPVSSERISGLSAKERNTAQRYLTPCSPPRPSSSASMSPQRSFFSEMTSLLPSRKSILSSLPLSKLTGSPLLVSIFDIIPASSASRHLLQGAVQKAFSSSAVSPPMKAFSSEAPCLPSAEVS